MRWCVKSKKGYEKDTDFDSKKIEESMKKRKATSNKPNTSNLFKSLKKSIEDAGEFLRGKDVTGLTTKKTKVNMKFIEDALKDGNQEAWESGELGRDKDHAKVFEYMKVKKLHKIIFDHSHKQCSFKNYKTGGS